MGSHTSSNHLKWVRRFLFWKIGKSLRTGKTVFKKSPLYSNHLHGIYIMLYFNSYSLIEFPKLCETTILGIFIVCSPGFMQAISDENGSKLSCLAFLFYLIHAVRFNISLGFNSVMVNHQKLHNDLVLLSLLVGIWCRQGRLGLWHRQTIYRRKHSSRITWWWCPTNVMKLWEGEENSLVTASLGFLFRLGGESYKNWLWSTNKALCGMELNPLFLTP